MTSLKNPVLGGFETMAGGAYAVPVEGPSLFLLSKTPLNMLMKFPKTPGLLG